MAAQIRSPWAAIIQLIRTELQTRTGFPAHRVLLRARGRTPSTHPVNSKSYLVLRASPPRPRGQEWAAAGRVNAHVSRTLTVEVRTRLGLGQMDRDDDWLLNATEGHYQLEEIVLDALSGFYPEDADGNLLTTQALPAPEPAESADKEEQTDPHWGHSTFAVEVHYQLALDQAR